MFKKFHNVIYGWSIEHEGISILESWVNFNELKVDLYYDGERYKGVYYIFNVDKDPVENIVPVLDNLLFILVIMEEVDGSESH